MIVKIYEGDKHRHGWTYLEADKVETVHMYEDPETLENIMREYSPYQGVISSAYVKEKIRAVRLLLYTAGELSTAALTNRECYIMNDAGQTIERLVPGRY